MSKYGVFLPCEFREISFSYTFSYTTPPVGASQMG